MLLLLDNLEQVIDCAPELASLLEACPNLNLLVTSRQLLRVRGEVEYAVPALAEEEAIELFGVRAQLEADEAITELCRRLDNLPLAVELAAARTSVLTPQQILERLSQRLDLLKGGRDADPRQQTLRATIEWSYDLLPPQEQRLFARLSVFSGGCTLKAAEDVAEADLDTLQSLVEKNLVRFTNGRYWLLATIREFAADRLLHSSDEAAYLERHATYFTNLVLEANASLSKRQDQEFWWSTLQVDYANIRTTLEHLHHRDRRRLLECATALRVFWRIRGGPLRKDDSGWREVSRPTIPFRQCAPGRWTGLLISPAPRAISKARLGMSKRRFELHAQREMGSLSRCCSRTWRGSQPPA